MNCKLLQIRDVVTVAMFYMFCLISQELSWRYRGLLDALERKRTERDVLGTEYLSKLRVKEVREFNYKSKYVMHLATKIKG